MTVTETTGEQHYETLSPDAQLFWRLQTRRNAEDSILDHHLTGESEEMWNNRLKGLYSTRKEIQYALDVMMLGLLDPPACPQPGLYRTAWNILLCTDPFVSLGRDDAARLEAIAHEDTGPVLSPDVFQDATIGACIEEEDRLNAILHIPGRELLVAHPATISLDHLQYAIRHGMKLEHASPELHTAILRFLETFDTMPKRTADSEDKPVAESNAAACVVLILRLLYLPQLLPDRVDMEINLTYCALSWRMAHDLWKGTGEWRADLNLLRTHLKALGRMHGNHRKMKCLEPYGPAVHTEEAFTLLESGLKIHEMMIQAANLNTPDIDPVVLDLPDTAAGHFAQRLSYVLHSHDEPRSQWGPRMKALAARVQNVPSPERCRPSLTDPFSHQAILDLIRPATRAAILLALSRTPGREVLTVCAVGLSQLREAARLGAPIGTMTFEFETSVRALWRSLGCPPCAWLTANHGPTGQEAEARRQQQEALIVAALEGQLTPETPAVLLPAPKSYAYTVWDNTEQVDTENQPELPFDDLSLTERLVLKALTGKTLVILGGICKPHAKAALIRDLNLKDVDWIESTEYDNGQQAASRLRDPNIVAVIFALRWAGHAHGSIRDAAWSLGIPAVSLPGGYSPRQILHQLSAQVSGSLAS